MGTGTSSSLQAIRKAKVQERDSIIKSSLQELKKLLIELKLTEEYIQKITRTPIDELVQMLNHHKITSKQLTVIYCYRSATIGHELELITEVNFKAALMLAEQRDDERRKSKKRNWTFEDSGRACDDDNGEFLPPLFGIPISIKDTFDMEGLTSTIGLTHRANQKQEKDGVFVSMLKESGLIPFVKSNVPQLAMIYDSFNFLWGRAKNPWDQKRSVGGSSGGEGGLIASRCSPIGVGSDIGGSIRIPAEFCGIFALKSSCARIANSYQTEYSTTFTGMDTLKVVIGPMSNSVEGLALWLKTVTTQSYFKGTYDPYNCIVPFKDNIYRQFQQKPDSKRKIKIGVLKSLEILQSSKASQRAVGEVSQKLKQLGYEVVVIEQIPNEKHVVRAFFAELAAEGGSQTFKKMLNGEEFIPQYGQMEQLSNLNTVSFFLAKMYMNRMAPRLAFLLEGSNKKTVHEYIQHVGMVYQYRKEFVDFWREKQLDFLVTPGFGCQASLHGFSEKLGLAACYTFIWNVLGMTVGSVPVTVCKKQEEGYQSQYTDEVTEKLQETGKGTAGLPVGVQIVSLPFEDQKVLGLMKVLEKQLGFYERHPLPK